MIHMTSPNVAYVGDVVPDPYAGGFMRIKRVNSYKHNPVDLVDVSAPSTRLWDASASWETVQHMRNKAKEN